MREWKNVLAKNFTWKYKLVPFYKGIYRREHFHSTEPEVIRLAKEIRYVLENVPLTLSEDQEFFGGMETFFAETLPEGVSEKEYEKNVLFCQENCPTQSMFYGIGHDHTALDFRQIVTYGLGWYIQKAEEGVRLHQNPVSEAMLLVLQAIRKFFLRAADHFETSRSEVSSSLRKLADHAPETFEEGLQLVWLLYIIVKTDGTRAANALARLDQYLYPLCRKSALPREKVLNLLCHIWTKVHEVHEVVNICIGGVTPEGEDAWNELSFLCLEATDLVHSPHTNLSARLGPETKDEAILACIKLIGTGIGFPAVFNDNVNIPMLQKLGIPLEAARDYAFVGCVEPQIPGRQTAWCDGRFSMPDCFRRTVLRLPEFHNIEELISACEREFRKDMKAFAGRVNESILAHPSGKYPDVLLSVFTRDCIERGRDVNDNGAEYPRFHGVGMMGLATITDSIAAVKKLVFDEKKIDPERLVKALETDFKDEEMLRLQLLNDAPKYGNDISRDCDDFAQRMVRFCADVCSEFRTADGGCFISVMASNINNVPAGAKLGATPDGRHAGAPLSDAASPYGGRDLRGPTAFVNSITSPDYTGQAATVVNMRFQPVFFNSEAGKKAMLSMLRVFINQGGQEMQFNVSGKETLEDAMAHPEKYEDLIVRVSGFSAYFNGLAEGVKKDIVRRTVHGC